MLQRWPQTTHTLAWDLELVVKTFIVIASLGILLAGCEAGRYLDRKDTVQFSDGTAVHANLMQHIVDPWPVHASNRDIAFNGPRMQAAVERYCNDKIKPPPSGSSTSGLGSGGGPLISVTNNNAPAGGDSKKARGCE